MLAGGSVGNNEKQEGKAMTPEQFWALEMQNQQQQYKQQQQNWQQIWGGMEELANAYGKQQDARNELGAADTMTKAMRDMRAIDRDTLEKYLAIPDAQRTMVFDNFMRPQLRAYGAGLTAQAQAKAYADARAAQPRNRDGYRVTY
jgi:hypothetical protein